MVKGTKVNNELGDLLGQFDKALKNFSHQLIAMAEKKEKEEKMIVQFFHQLLQEEVEEVVL
ncbi:hypothetical protein [Lactococcus sp. DD01]|uniref:hypothetical protein n=1 Tax=Lactococcus sp. DD01 TaxID=1776443 RepID=UPI000776A2BD|nr:hypothetical protein [Lactococcus sp. DD01]KXT59414.1 hypothetical protein LACDD01_02069 [Lactococcus sp. DD01]